MIEFAGLTARYPHVATNALQDVSFRAERAQITAVVGPNGSGKSTLVRTLIRTVTPIAGRIEIDGAPVGSLTSRALAARIAVVTQREEQIFPLRVREYVALGRYPHLGMWTEPAQSDRDATSAAMRITEVDQFAERTVGELSGGEWQRVRLARAIAQGGDAIVLDEPSTFLDIAHEMAIFELLGTLASSGKAVLLVSHQLNLVARFAGHMVLLNKGRVEAVGTPHDVMQQSILERVYEWPLAVVHDPLAGAPALLPLRKTSASA